MPKVDVVNLENQKVGEIELSDQVFGAAVNEALLYESVRHYMAGIRSGTHKTKVRREVSGSGKKLWRQKGTGRARMGSIRSPIWRHGGTVHGPVPRDYSYRLPRKMLLGALRSALSAKLRDGELKVVQSFAFADHKTRTVAGTLKKFDNPRTCLLVEAGENKNLEMGSRNIPGVKAVLSRAVTTYDLLRYKQILLSEAAAKKLSEGLA
ncbi:MAG: 50S ribosomal protein L4 [Bryobacterales bacterium]|nr:50S ribosomal protein L4 [Bryobacterales bacterium]